MYRDKGTDAQKAQSGFFHLIKYCHKEDDRCGDIGAENFDRNMTLSSERNDQCEWPKQKGGCIHLYSEGFSSESFFDSLQGSSMTLAELVDVMIKFFVAAEHKRTLIREWDDTMLEKVTKTKQNEKKMEFYNFLAILVKKIQFSLSNTYQNNEILDEKVRNAVKMCPRAC